MSSFDSLGLSAALLRGVSEQGYAEPTPIQARVIPVVLGLAVSIPPHRLVTDAEGDDSGDEPPRCRSLLNLDADEGLQHG